MRERQDRADAWHLLETPEVGVVLQVTCSPFFQLIAQLTEANHLAEHDAEHLQLLLRSLQLVSRWRTVPCGRYLQAAAVYLPCVPTTVHAC